MRYSSTTLICAIAVAFIAGLGVSPQLRHAIPEAHAQAASLQPAMIDLLALKHADLPRTAVPELNSKLLVNTENATVSVQSGNVGKHIHRKTDEIQYIIEGSGTMWLGNERREFRPGTLIIIPRDTPHAGAIVASGPVKAIAIKIPPQAKDDITFVH
jgi:mannose-6-phosphate isomerase-like protein (cupin superfamily)